MGAGLFPDDSPLLQINREAAVLGAAGYAILLQVAHPSVGRGVHEHSDFAERPLDRLRGTLTFVYGTVFGTADEAERVSRIVRARHVRVNGDGYRALDPDLQVWVAATLYEGSLRMYELLVGPLSAAEKEVACAQASIFATALGCPAEHWPKDLDAFTEYWRHTVDTVEVTDAARHITRSLFNPPNPLLRAAARAQRFLAAGLLPPRIRDALGLEWGATQQRRFDRLVYVTRVVYPRLPRALRHLPKDLCLWDMRRQIARNRLYVRPSGRRRPPAVTGRRLRSPRALGAASRPRRGRTARVPRDRGVTR
ncbi:oxygenase MpaB family protein [Marinactinospora thermotolerans]|uniref:Uncharacterized conserved protein, DUF2236 family n=1 Tax=Marinactinospora thermotolerans DSM 45154 TaxID=1122192 RepID=A0A1T4SM03_9ACTN|nr:oxygenase MpaB family protein [Marinactinospora thermotolerans]SKA29249.1 Uncharacterized conserved protein, DUF2236 family [Marinactinospora thermotolerans DSM 45154]